MRRGPTQRTAKLGWAMQHLSRKCFSFLVSILASSAALYHLWMDRNACIFSNKATDPSSVFKDIENDGRDRISSWGLVETLKGEVYFVSMCMPL